MPRKIVPISEHLTPGATLVDGSTLQLPYEQLFAFGVGSARRRILAAVSVGRQIEIALISVSSPSEFGHAGNVANQQQATSRLIDAVRQAYALLGEMPPAIKTDFARNSWTFELSAGQESAANSN